MRNAVVRTDLVRVHAEEAALLVRLRGLMVDAPNVRMADLHDLDGRLRGHMSFLRASGAAGLDEARATFGDNPEAGEVTIFAAKAMIARDDGFADEVFAACADDVDIVTALAAAFRYCDAETRRHYLKAWLFVDDPRLVGAVFVAAIEERLDLDDMLVPFLADGRPEIRSRALEYVGIKGLADQTDAVKRAMTDPEVAMAGSVAGCRFELPEAANHLIGSLTDQTTQADWRTIVEVGFLTIDESPAREAVRALLTAAETRRWGILALGTLGAVSTIPFLIEEMSKPETARIAAWSFEMITGANVAEDDLELAEFPDDPELELSAEEEFFDTALPWPDPTLVQGWMSEHGGGLASEHPLLFGLPRWSLQDMQNPDFEYQARYRSLAQWIGVRAAGNRLPNWRTPVGVSGNSFSRDWQT